ncbi:MAG: N-acetylmuramoyl-L-alanine amidase [Verrucomicrobiota bacterium]
MQRSLPLLVILLLLSVGLFSLLRRPAESTAIAPPPRLSSLALPPDWNQLNALPSLTNSENLRHSLKSIYALPNSSEDYLEFRDSALVIQPQSTSESETFILPLSLAPSEDTPAPLPPLNQLHIAIDPGHIGGDYAIIEQRNFDPTPDDPSDTPVREGDLTLTTARHLKPLLENLGCQVTLLRDSPHPVTDATPEDFLPEYPDRATAEKLFYRTAEIRARAHLVNNIIKPHLILCLHYNADAWNGENPWAKNNHFHILLHGAYMKPELALDDQRFEMIRHLLTQTTERALPLARTISDHFLSKTELVPYHYKPTAPAIHLDKQRPIYARNLLANRLYQAPTIFMEPYVMNHQDTFHRVQLGDYEGLQEINGQLKPSLVREYAQLLAEAIKIHYQK